MSTQAGSKVGLPTSGGIGSLAMSPSGGDKTGLGGAGGGTGIGRGDSTGSGMNGAGPGAGKTDIGRGTDPTARGGISPAPGPGGAGNVPSGSPPVRGVDISGGSSQVTIPAFGSDGSSAGDAQSPGRSTVKAQRSFDVDIVATANSGGAFEPYKNLLHGEKHTIYPETYSSLGTAAMEYSESTTGRGVFSPPQGIRTNLPEGLPHARMVVTCTLDASGNLKGIRVLEAGPAEMTAKVLAALGSWKFQPAMRANQPVEVTAILGFGINTNDRF
jgi:TonB family protein